MGRPTHLSIPPFPDVTALIPDALGVPELRARRGPRRGELETMCGQVLLEHLEVVVELPAHLVLDRWFPEAGAKLAREASQPRHARSDRQVGSSRIRATPSAKRAHCFVSIASRSRPASVSWYSLT